MEVAGVGVVVGVEMVMGGVVMKQLMVHQIQHRVQLQHPRHLQQGDVVVAAVEEMVAVVAEMVAAVAEMVEVVVEMVAQPQAQVQHRPQQDRVEEVVEVVEVEEVVELVEVVEVVEVVEECQRAWSIVE